MCGVSKNSKQRLLTQLQYCSGWGVLIITLCFGRAERLVAQTAEIAGRITDGGGGVVPQTTVTLIHLDSGTRRTARSNDEGFYGVPFLQPGRYKLIVHKPGFKTITRPNIRLLTKDSVRIDAVLELGELSESVTVQASGIELESSTSSVGVVVEEQLKREVPNLVNGGKRSPASYLLMAPGLNPGAGGHDTIAGGRTFSHEVLIDGQTGDSNSDGIGYVVSFPSVESVSEFKLELSSMPAEYGRSSGGMTLFATKSGSNQWHGLAYEYLRNPRLDARPWQAAERDVRKQNEFGFAMGGPLVLPGVYDGRARTFFFANATAYALRTDGSSGLLTLPTAEMRRGDFSAAGLNPIHDALSPYLNRSNSIQRRPFPGNRIPAERLSRVSKFFLDRLPLPNRPGVSNNFVGTSRYTSDAFDQTIKIDHTISEQDRISVYYQLGLPESTAGSILGDEWGFSSVGRQHRIRLDWSRNFSSNFGQQLQYGVNRDRSSSQSNNFTQNFGQRAGLQGMFDPNCPEVNIDYPGGLFICGPGRPADIQATTAQTLNYGLRQLLGRHSLKYGLQFIRFNKNINRRGGQARSSSAGYFGFGNVLGDIRNATSDTNGQGGESWADFVLGWPQEVRVASPVVLGNRETYLAAYLQDDWKITQRLTLNLGLRWDLNIPYHEIHGQITGFDPTLPNPAATGQAGALTFYGSGPGRNGKTRPGEIWWSNFGPRLGFAFQLTSRTVLRGFGGMVYQGIQNSNAAFADRSGFQASGSPPIPIHPYDLYYSWDEPFPQHILGSLPNTNPALRNGQSLEFQDPHTIGRAPELYMYSLGIQRELPGNILLDVTYISNNMKHATDLDPINQLNPAFRSLGALLTQPLNSPQVQAAGFRAPFPEFDQRLPLYRALLPFPQYEALTNTASTRTSSTYHAAILKAQKRFSSGLAFLVSYTTSKYLTDTTWAPGAFGAAPRDAFNRKLEKGLQRFDTPQRVVLSYAYELPFGPGKKYFSSPGRVKKALLSGWSVAGIHQYYSGVPAAITGSLSIPIPTVTGRANRVPGVPVRSTIPCNQLEFGNPSRNYIFNAGNPEQAARTGRLLAFDSAGDYQIGNAPSMDPQARQCGVLNEDVTLTKTMYLKEGLRLRFGAEAFNVFNRHSWESGIQGQGVSSSNFGEITPVQRLGPRQLQLKFRVEW
jgi:Carboxypeptidase regulatory-like domain